MQVHSEMFYATKISLHIPLQFNNILRSMPFSLIFPILEFTTFPIKDRILVKSESESRSVFTNNKIGVKGEMVTLREKKKLKKTRKRNIQLYCQTSAVSSGLFHPVRLFSHAVKSPRDSSW